MVRYLFTHFYTNLPQIFFYRNQNVWYILIKIDDDFTVLRASKKRQRFIILTTCETETANVKLPIHTYIYVN